MRTNINAVQTGFLDFDMPDVEPIEVEPQRCLCCEQELSAEAYCQDCAETVLDYHIKRMHVLTETVDVLKQECRSLWSELESLKNGAE